MSKPQDLFITPSNLDYPIFVWAVELPQRQFGIRDQSHIWAFDGNSLVSFLTASKNQNKYNLPAQDNDGVNSKKGRVKSTFIFCACYSKNFMCVFCSSVSPSIPTRPCCFLNNFMERTVVGAGNLIF